MLTLRQLIDGATSILAEAGVASPQRDALALAQYCLGLPRLELAMAPDMTSDQMAQFTALVDRRRRREPLQQIVGSTGFRYITLQMMPGVFVPRPETEVVAGVAIAEIDRLLSLESRPVLLVDLCTGSGAIAASAADETSAQIVAIDADPDAVTLARRNTASAGDRVRIELGDVRDPDLLADLAGTVDVVVSNPPYIPLDAVPIDPEVADHDPELALYGGGLDGMALPTAVVHAAQRLLRPAGLLVMEHADSQGGQARAVALATAGFAEVGTGMDLTERDRYLWARRHDEPR
ncbi:MAG: peptide chain release factor N(5)-glutamine methyltransferase [Beutenbergiaceae bacterium]